MNNDPELNGKYLGQITQDFVRVADTLKEAAYQIRKRGFSEYPIFPVSKSEITIGSLLLGKNELEINWNYYASFLDEFVQLQLIQKDKVDAFKASYKDPDEFCCLFIIDEGFTNFVYIPFPED